MKKILVVDDEPYLLRLMSGLLDSEGYAPTAVADGPEALKLIKSEPFDLIITDIRMEPMNGVDLLKRSKEMRPGLAVIVMTAYFSTETENVVMALGAAAHIRKPFMPLQLLDQIEEVFDRQRIPA